MPLFTFLKFKEPFLSLTIILWVKITQHKATSLSFELMNKLMKHYYNYGFNSIEVVFVTQCKTKIISEHYYICFKHRPSVMTVFL